MRYTATTLALCLLGGSSQAQQTQPSQVLTPDEPAKVTAAECAQWRNQASKGERLPDDVLRQFVHCVLERPSSGIAPSLEPYLPADRVPEL
jgi:hypothetical protein